MISPKLYAEYAASPEAFRRDLLVDVSGSVKTFGECQDDWQRSDFAAMDAGLMRCAGRSEATDAVMYHYIERPRGHSKTTDIAVTVVWALAFATRPLKGYAYAADQDQAKLLKNSIEVLCRLNPWLAEIIEVQKALIVNVAKGHPGYNATMEIGTSDVASSYGINPDIVVCDELTHWEGDGALMDSVFSSVGKRESCLLLIISNAGFVDSWQHKFKENARTGERWNFSRLEGPKASWMSERMLEEQRRMLPGLAFNRLWLNEWSNAGGDALTTEDIDAAFIPHLRPLTGNEPDTLFVGGLDLGLTRDCAAFVILAVPSGGKAGKIYLAADFLWRPTLGKKIDLIDVQKTILAADKQFGLETVAFDPYQAEHLAQTLEADSEHKTRNSRRTAAQLPWMREIPPVAANLRQQATLTIEFFNDHRVKCYECENLQRDLKRLRVEEKSYGCRLTSPRDNMGHGDTFSAFALALIVAHEFAGQPQFDWTFESSQSLAEQHAERLAAWEAEWQAERETREKSRGGGKSWVDALDDGSLNFDPRAFGFNN